MNEEYFVSLAKASILGENPENPPKDIDWEYIWNKAYKQNLTGLIAESILRLPPEIQPENTELWNEGMMQTLFLMSQKFAEFDRITRMLINAGIDVVCLKGIVTKDLYPVPELRVMGDFDIFVSKSQIDAVSDIFKNEGYELKKEVVGITAQKGKILWEVFSSLEQEFRENTEEYDEKLFCGKISWDNGLYRLNNTHMLAHMILHFGQHLIYTGSGIRNLLDIVLFLKKYKDDTDFEEVKRICADNYFERLYQYIMTAVDEIFGVPIEHEDYDIKQFIDTLLVGGVFGEAAKNVMARQTSRQVGNVGMIRRVFFPTCEMLKTSYPYLKKHRWLLPFAWVHRIFRARIHRGFKFKKMITDLGEGVQYAKKHDKRMKELEIYTKKFDKE